MIEISGTSFWVVLFIAGMVAIGLAIAMRRFLRSPSTGLGVLYVLGMLVLAWSLLPTVSQQSTSPSSDSALTSNASLVDYSAQRSMVIGSSKDQERSWLDLSHDRQQIAEFISRAHSNQKIPVLYAGNGVDGFHSETLSNMFGSVVATDNAEVQTVCYASNSVLGFRSGICQSRDIRLYIKDTVVVPLASDFKGRIVGATALVKGKPVVLLTYQIGDAKSAEESCLAALSSGASCLTPTLFPMHTQHILVVNPGPFEEEFESFGLTKPKVDTQACAPLGKSIPSSDSSEGTHSFSEIRSELELDRYIESFLRTKNFAPLSHLNLEHLKHFTPGSSGEKAIIRSLLTKLLRTPIWLTDCDEISARLAGFNALQLASDKESLVELKGADATSALKLTLTSPTKVSTQSVAQVTISGATGWSVGIVNERSAQILIPRGSPKLGISIPRVADSPFSTNHDTRLILLMALMFGGTASLLQTIAVPRHRQTVGFHVGTSLPVATLFFVSIWYSYQASLAAGTGSDAVTDLTTSLQMPLPVAEVPESFFQSTAQPMAEGLAQRLEKLLALVPGAPETKMKLIKRDTPSYKFRYSQKTDVIVHNSIAARNYFYRKSPTYLAAVSAIEQILSEKKIVFKIVDDDTLLQELQGKSSVLIVPDVRFLPAESIGTLDSWLKNGGVLVFSDHLDVVIPPVESALAAKLQEAFGAAYSGIETASWSKTPFVSGDFEIDHSHRVIPGHGTEKIAVLGKKYGNGALVFLGAQPFGKGSALLFDQLVKNLTGQTLQASTGKVCNTMLVVEPYQLTKGEYSSLSQSAGDQVINLGIDAKSLPNMVDQWGDLKDNIVAVDDGQWRQRYLVHEIFRTWWDLPTVFLRRDSDKFTQQGPDSHVLVARYGFSKTDSVAGMVQEWRQNCANGYANPRIVSSGWLKKNVSALTGAMSKAGLRSLKPKDLNESVEKTSTPEESLQSFSALKSDPLNFTEEVAK